MDRPVECLHCEGKSLRRGNISTHLISKHPDIANERRCKTGQVKAILDLDYRFLDKCTNETIFNKTDSRLPFIDALGTLDLAEFGENNA